MLRATGPARLRTVVSEEFKQGRPGTNSVGGLKILAQGDEKSRTSLSVKFDEPLLPLI